MTVKLNYQIYGTGEPLYLLHGLFGSNRNWLTIARQLNGAVQIVAVDLRNHGDSEHTDSMRYTEMADDVVALAGSLGHKSINVLGHSMGGKVAMAMALQDPGLIHRLIIVDIAPVVYNPKHDDLISILQALPIKRLGNRAEASVLLAQDIPNTVLRQFLLQNLVKDDNAGYRWRINLEGIRHNYDNVRSFPAELQHLQFHGPSLFLAGSQSDYVRPEHHAAILTSFPKAKIVIIEGAGHWVHADKPETVTAEVRNFLAE